MNTGLTIACFDIEGIPLFSCNFYRQKIRALKEISVQPTTTIFTFWSNQFFRVCFLKYKKRIYFSLEMAARLFTGSFKKKKTWYTIYLQYNSSNTSTCFGHIYTPSSGGTTVWIQQLVLIVLFRWLTVVLAGFQWWWAIDTPETCRGVWRNIQRINCAIKLVFM